MPEMRTLASSQRIRSLLLAAILLVLVIIYVTTGESQTKNSPFYKRTTALMEAKRRGDTAASELLHTAPATPQDDRPEAAPRRRAKPLGAAGPAGPVVMTEDGTQGQGQVVQPASGQQQGTGQQPLGETDETLKQRLKNAEHAAKKSADDKYRALKDIEDEVARDRSDKSRTVPLNSPNKHTKHPAEEAQKKKNNNDEEKIASKEKEAKTAGKNKMPPYQAPPTKPKSAIEAQQPARKAMKEEDEDPAVTAVRSTLADILQKAPMTIFSKSYCPFSLKAKKILLEAYTITPTPFVVELDLHPQGQELQALLQKITGRRTVPNVLVNGKTLGGGDEMELLWKSGELPARVKQIGGKKVEDVKQNFAHGEEAGRDGLKS